LLNVESERSVDLFSTQEPVFPLLVLVIAVVIVLIGLMMSIMKKNPFYFLVVLILGLSVAGIVSPWWTLQGSSSDVQTSSALYLIPLDLVTTTKNISILLAESWLFFPDLFVDVHDLFFRC
jgi:uncharacterized membrane protein YiaA